jgi:hypothetical protein
MQKFRFIDSLLVHCLQPSISLRREENLMISCLGLLMIRIWRGFALRTEQTRIDLR